MQNYRHTKKLIIAVAGITAGILIYTGAVTQMQKKHRNDPPASYNQTGADSTAIQDEDSVEVIGTPTGDDPWKEVNKLVATYYSSTGKSYKGMVKVIDDNQQDEKVLEEHPFEYTILKDDYYYRLAHMELVSKKNYLLAVDNENKTISMAPKASLQKANKTFDIRDFKKIMEKGQARARVTQLGGEKVLTIDHIADANIQGYRIYYSPKNHSIRKMLIGMVRLSPLEDDNGQVDELDNYYYYLEVLFTHIQSLELNEKEFTPENKFIQVQNGRIGLTPAYKEYQLVNGQED
jgi:hypothetical protein